MVDESSVKELISGIGKCLDDYREAIVAMGMIMTEEQLKSLDDRQLVTILAAAKATKLKRMMEGGAK